MYSEELKIPKERIPILIGVKGIDKRKIENQTETKLDVDSREGDIMIFGENSLNVFLAKSIVQAIGRGFNPKIALTLLNEKNSFELVDIKPHAKTEKDVIRIRSRLIGTHGIVRKTLEDLTDTKIMVYGRTVGIIGETINVLKARQAIGLLLKGSKHGNVYGFLEKE